MTIENLSQAIQLTADSDEKVAVISGSLGEIEIWAENAQGMAAQLGVASVSEQFGLVLEHARHVREVAEELGVQLEQMTNYLAAIQ